MRAPAPQHQQLQVTNVFQPCLVICAIQGLKQSVTRRHTSNRRRATDQIHSARSVLARCISPNIPSRRFVGARPSTGNDRGYQFVTETGVEFLPELRGFTAHGACGRMNGPQMSMQPMSLQARPARYVLLPLATLATGYSVKAMERKIERGDWQEGKVWRRAPDGRICIDLEGFARWVESR